VQILLVPELCETLGVSVEVVFLYVFMTFRHGASVLLSIGPVNGMTSYLFGRVRAYAAEA